MTPKLLFWIDLEMTGLDEVKDSILEIAIMVTDTNFNPLEEYQRIVYQPQEVLDNMNDWCKEHHGKSGLTAAVKSGTPLAVVEKEVIALMDRHFQKNKRVVLAGNSVWNDRKFIDRYMPEFSKRLHYRIIDVSSFKEVFKQKYGMDFEKAKSHRAIDDVRESIEELKLYLSYVTPPPPPAAKPKPDKTAGGK